MTYVTFVLQELFGYDEQTATKLMLQVHHEGRAIVSSGPRERMEHDTSRLHAYGLWASYQRDVDERAGVRACRRAAASVRRRGWTRPRPRIVGLLLDQLEQLLAADADDVAGDPVMARLLPEGHRGDPSSPPTTAS